MTTTTTNEFTFEAILAVRDYNGDFDETREAHADAIRQFEKTAADQGIEVKVTGVCFNDFDSSNPTHACAYFLIDYRAEKEVEY